MNTGGSHRDQKKQIQKEVPSYIVIGKISPPSTSGVDAPILSDAILSTILINGGKWIRLQKLPDGSHRPRQ
jgi:hypothetical protein